jgi:hypothetical protein
LSFDNPENKITIPLAYGPNIFSHLGYVMAQAVYRANTGKKVEAGQLATDWMMNTIGTILPLNVDKGPKALLPEPLKIIYNVVENQNDFGGKLNYAISEEDKNKSEPHWKVTNPETGDIYKGVAVLINAMTINPLKQDYMDAINGYSAGVVNPTGEGIKYVTQQLAGGPLKTVTQIGSLAERAIRGDARDIKGNEIPVVDALYRTTLGREQVRPAYYRNVEEYNNLVDTYKTAAGEWDDGKGDWKVPPDEAKMAAMLKEHSWLEGAEVDAATKEGKRAQRGSLMEFQKNVKKQIKDLRNEREAISADLGMDGLARRNAMRDLDEEIAVLQKDFVREFNAAENPSQQMQ